MTDVVLAGVGGQGAVLTARVLAETALYAGYDVKTSEVHGMAQRGGSVVSMVRWGEKVHSPLIPVGGAHFFLAFELLEGLRQLEFLRDDGTAIVNEYRLDPLPVLRGDARYPEDALNKIRAYVAHLVELDARRIAADAGNARALGSVMLGALSAFLDLPSDAWEQSINRFVPARAREVNLRAFAMGRESGAVSI